MARRKGNRGGRSVPSRLVWPGSSHGLCRAGCRGPWWFGCGMRGLLLLPRRYDEVWELGLELRSRIGMSTLFGGMLGPGNLWGGRGVEEFTALL